MRSHRIVQATEKYKQRLMIAVGMTGLLRAEWAMARWGQIIPCNWQQIDYVMWLENFTPLGYLVADARNLAVQEFLGKNCEWLVFIDHDTIIPPDFYIKLNERILHERVPVWSGLYFTKSVPAEPLVYRERGKGYFAKWKLGDKVWTDSVPMGCTVIHASILKAMYADAEVYKLGNTMTCRRVFNTPGKVWFDPATASWEKVSGTEDLDWCWRVKRDGYFKKAGWAEYQKKEFPFLVDTSIFCKHITEDGTQYPSRGEEQRFMKTVRVK